MSFQSFAEHFLIKRICREDEHLYVEQELELEWKGKGMNPRERPPLWPHVEYNGKKWPRGRGERTSWQGASGKFQECRFNLNRSLNALLKLSLTRRKVGSPLYSISIYFLLYCKYCIRCVVNLQVSFCLYGPPPGPGSAQT